jgi:hypothetical protein
MEASSMQSLLFVWGWRDTEQLIYLVQYDTKNKEQQMKNAAENEEQQVWNVAENEEQEVQNVAEYFEYEHNN